MTIHVIDRSTAQRYVDCPWQGWKVDADKIDCGSPEATSGTEAHEAISEALRAVLSGSVGLGDAVDLLIDRARRSRPDVQPDVLQAVRYCAYEVLRRVMYFTNGEERHPQDIMAYDGGEGDQAGQLSWDLPIGDDIARVTCEVDLLMATDSPAMVDLYDWKTGRAVWSVSDISDSFQLGCWYPAVVMLNYPTVEVVQARVWNTRANELTPPVPFRRGRWLTDALARIETACKAVIAARSGVEVGPTPKRDVCACCPVVRHCPMPKADTEGPTATLAKLIVAEQQVSDLKEELKAYVMANGDVTLPDGTCFGLNKPKSKRKPTPSLYSTTHESEE